MVELSGQTPSPALTAGLLSRRRVLGGIGLAAGLAGATALAGCAEQSGPEAASSSVTTWRPPAYIPFDGVSPDLPGTDAGVAPAFFSYPASPAERPDFPLPQTDPVTALLQFAPPPLPPERNPSYQLFRQQAGNLMDANGVPSAQYNDRFQVIMAGGDLPDFMQMVKVQQFPALLESKFSDLTDQLAGDAIAQFPGLANIPTPAWDIPRVNGRIWGIPQPRPPAGRILSTRGDLLARKGIDPYPELSSGEDFVALLAELTDRGSNEFALGSDPVSWLLNGLLEMMGAPNVWAKNPDGTFTHQYTSPQMVEALNEGAKIIKAGYLHPNSFSDPGQMNTWWRAGTTSLYWQSFVGWGTFARSDPDWNIGYVRLPQWNGGGKAAVWKLQAGYPAFVAIKKQASQDRLVELLRLADFIASPFGTQQFLVVNYGAEGATYTMTANGPEFIPDRKVNAVQGWQYCGGNSGAVLFVPGQEETVRKQHAYLSEIIPAGVTNPTSGLYSETEQSKGASWNKRLADTQAEVLRGAKSVAAWETLAADWKAQVGDTIANEYAEAATRS